MKSRLLILLYLLSSLLTPMTGSARPGGQIVAIDNSVFVALVDSSIEGCICVQEKENWCWAACIQMILQYNGQNVSQNNIVIEVIGNSCNRSASGNQIETAFDGWRGYTVYSCQSKKPQYFIDEISSGHPLIIGIGEHAYLLTHIYYKEALNGMLHPFKAILINPKSGNEEVKDWNDMYSNANTIVSFHR